MENRLDGQDHPPVDPARPQAGEPAPQGTFAEGLFVPKADDAAPDDRDAPKTDAGRMEEIGNASMPPGGAYA